MKVRELIAELEQYDPEMGVATEAMGHVHTPADLRSHGPSSVGILRHYAGDYVIVGNLRLFTGNYPNWYMLGEEEMFQEGLV